MTCVNISKTTTTNGTPSSHSNSGIVHLHFPKHWNRNASALRMFHRLDCMISLSCDTTGNALSANNAVALQSARRQRPLLTSELSQHDGTFIVVANVRNKDSFESFAQ
jgi:hypothetical protein